MRGESRRLAMLWWHGLSSGEKTRIVDTSTVLPYIPARRWETLTGREIEILYHKVIKQGLL